MFTVSWLWVPLYLRWLGSFSWPFSCDQRRGLRSPNVETLWPRPHRRLQRLCVGADRYPVRLRDRCRSSQRGSSLSKVRQQALNSGAPHANPQRTDNLESRRARGGPKRSGPFPFGTLRPRTERAAMASDEPTSIFRSEADLAACQHRTASAIGWSAPTAATTRTTTSRRSSRRASSMSCGPRSRSRCRACCARSSSTPRATTTLIWSPLSIGR